MAALFYVLASRGSGLLFPPYHCQHSSLSANSSSIVLWICSASSCHYDNKNPLVYLLVSSTISVEMCLRVMFFVVMQLWIVSETNIKHSKGGCGDIPTLRRLRQEVWEFDVSFGNVVKLCYKTYVACSLETQTLQGLSCICSQVCVFLVSSDSVRVPFSCNKTGL